MIELMLRSSNGSSICHYSISFAMFQIVFLTHMGRILEILFKRIYWQVLLQKAIDNRTMMIGHPAFAD